MIPTNYSHYTRGSFWRTAILTTVLALFNAFLFAQTTCDAEAGSLNGEICIQNQDVTLKATLRGDTIVPDSFQIVYVLTRGDSLVITEVSEEPSFSFNLIDLEGVYTIHTLVYDSTTLDLDSIEIGETTGFDLFETFVAGGGTICAALDTAGVKFRFGNCDEDGCDADAGALVAVEGACFQDSSATLTATIQDSAVVPDGYSLLYVLTAGDSLVIEQVNDEPTFNVDTVGTYRIHVLVYDSTTLDLDSIVIGETTGGDVNLLLLQGGGEICGALDVTGAVFNIEACDEDACTADAGTVSIDGGGTSITFCPGDGEDDILNLDNTDADLDSGTYVYLVTDTGNVVINIITDASENFETADSGTYRIYGFVYTADSLSIAEGDTLSLTTPVDSCSDLSTNFITVTVDCDNVQPTCTAAVGRTTGMPIGCLDGDSIVLSVSVQEAPTVPSGYDVLYVLTSGDSLVIEQVNDDPSFEVDSAGTYRVHVLVYDSTTLDLSTIVFGETTGADVDALLAQGGGDICGALDVNGVLFTVINCPDSQDSCVVTFGSLVAVNDSICLDSTPVSIAANIAVAPIVLDSYQLVYVLTSGDDLVIEEISDDPSFTVDSVGTYRIHVLVYDSTTLNLDSLITFGETNGADIDSLLIQGGGEICAALDTNGLVFNIEACQVPSDSCNVEAGSLVAVEGACLQDSTATLTATIADSAVVTDGYQVVYVLTRGDSLVIEQVNDEPTFTVDTLGTYRIHTLVYDSTTLDLDSIVIGETTGGDVNLLLIQGGGEICGALDVTGAIFNIAVCDSTTCQADVGRLSAEAISCLDSTLILSATALEEATIPNGYAILYVLTRGDSLIITDVNDEPSFTVDTIGLYTIHTLVYDSTTLDLNIVDFDTTSATVINDLLIQGGGEICGALDVEGVSFNVVNCDSTCIVQSGRIIAFGDEADFCLSENTDSVRLNISVQTAPIVLPGYERTFLLTSGDSLLVEASSDSLFFTVNTIGDFRIHTFVYDTTDINLDSLITFGETTISDIDSLLIQGGGDICSALDTAGLLFSIDTCSTTPDSCLVTAGSLSASSTPCFADTTTSVTLNAMVAETPNVPAGYQVTYVLTSGTDQVIEAVNDAPSFDVDTTGRYTIHTLVYDSTTLDLSTIQFGMTTGGDVNTLLIQGGGEICGALDVEGIVFNVISCDSTGVDSCGVVFKTGKLRIIGNDVRCYEGESITTELRFTDSPTIPTGYAVAFVISQGDSNTITQVNQTLSLTADSIGLYRIHVLIYDSTSLDLNSLIGSTASDFNDQLAQGGGSTCAAFDTTGIVFIIKNCDDADDDCYDNINVGRLINDYGYICADSLGNATLIATISTPAMLDSGYQVTYLLSYGADRVIEAVSDSLSFDVNGTGIYRIHVLVYDPTTFDLSEINLGQTTAGDLDDLFIQGGGEICAALNFAGLEFDIRDCACGAYAGELNYSRPNGRNACLTDGLAFLAGNTKTRAVVPPGYQRVYVLTSGENLIIERIADIPVFGVRATGTYRIHTLVYDPSTIDLSDVVLGETSATEINELLRQGGGELCGALELPGLEFSVSNCAAQDGFTVFPNPATNQVNITLPEVNSVQRVRIEMIDMNGNIAKQWQMDNYRANNNLDINDIQPGMYYIRVLYDQEFVQEMRIVKVR